MNIERYYSSLREEVSPLAPDAATLLEEEDYVGFFKACGPNYVRGIRRTQQVIAVLSFQSSSSEGASQYSFAIQSGNWKYNAEGKSKYKNSRKSLVISIRGYGLGLSQEGSETLVATSIAEYKQVMKFAYKAMTMADDSMHVGMVYGIELAPWVHNVEFQNAAQLAENDIITPMPRALIPRAYPKDAKNFGEKFFPTNNDVEQKNFRCKDLSTPIDKYGYCCEDEQMWDVTNQKYRTFGTVVWYKDVCKPLRTLTPEVLKDNMANNGEFVARLDSAMRYKLNYMGTVEKCISSANSVPDEFLDNKLEPLATVKNDRITDHTITLRMMKMGIDPEGDYSMLKHLGNELDEWIDMYYTPCFAALYGMNVGSAPDTDATYFMAYPWFSHPECMKLSCLTPNMRWNRDKGGCVAGLVNGVNAAEYVLGKDSNCAKDPESTGKDETCKHMQKGLTEHKKKVDDCRVKLPNTANASYIVTNFCMPNVTTKKISKDIATVNLYWTCRTGGVPPQAPLPSRKLSEVAEKIEEKDATVPIPPTLSDENDFVASLRSKIESV